MFIDFETFFFLPPLWHIGIIILICLSFEAVLRRREYWAFPALMVYGTTWIWYYPDLNGRWEIYQGLFTLLEIDIALAQLILYMVTFRIVLPLMATKFIGKEEHSSALPKNFSIDSIFLVVLALWFLVLTIGVVSHGKGLVEALFPIGGRRTWSFMFGRAHTGGTWDWLISIAGNTYTILVVFLGLFLFMPKSSQLQHVNILAYAISLPFFMFTGTRSAFVQVVFPVLLGFFLLAQVPFKVKVIWSICFFLLLNSILVAMLFFRNIGFEGMFASSEAESDSQKTVQFHDGANMLEELLFINQFQTTGEYPNQWFGNYLAELGQFIPRAYWPNKPLIGAELSMLRGFRDGSGRQTGTVAMGKVGQGVVNIGPFFGPMLTALLVAAYCGWLCRLWVQECSPLRTFLYIGGLCFIFNLGRNVGILNLWPIIFGYCLVLAIEKTMGSQEKRTRNTEISRQSSEPSVSHHPLHPL